MDDNSWFSKESLAVQQIKFVSAGLVDAFGQVDEPCFKISIIEIRNFSISVVTGFIPSTYGTGDDVVLAKVVQLDVS